MSMKNNIVKCSYTIVLCSTVSFFNTIKTIISLSCLIILHNVEYEHIRQIPFAVERYRNYCIPKYSNVGTLLF